MSSVTDEIKARVDLVELIGRALQLRRSGSSFKGLCPFHQEKTPSFYVFPTSHTWVCFGCGKKGTAFDWLMEREHLEFGEALRTLAQMTGVELPARRDPEVEETTARLYDLLARAQLYYQGLLQGTSGAAARRYLAGRGAAEATIAQFGLGYAPGGNGLLRHFQEQGFTPDEMTAAGVISLGDDGHPFDFFRERVLFPIRDRQGRTIAFGGRTLGEGTPKYLNSRDTLLFHKQETLFAIDLARKAIGQERRAVVVEGYMDALMAHQHGYRNVVATLGTAITERHLRLLRNLADEIVLALDSDAAGQAATWRALEVAQQGLQAGVTPVMGPSRRQRQYVAARAAQLKVLRLPSAKDPDELIRADPAAWGRLVLSAKAVIDFVLEQLGDRHDLSTGRGKAAAAEEVADVLASVADPIEQAHYVQETATLLKVDEAAVREALRRRRRWGRRAAADGGDRTPPDAGDPDRAAGGRPEDLDGDPLDAYALALLLQPGARPTADPARGADSSTGAPPGEQDFALPQARALFRLLASAPEGLDLDGLRRRASPELRPYLERAARFVPDAARFSEDDVLIELGRLRLQMHERDLLARKQDVVGLLRDAAGGDEEARWRDELSRLAQQLQAVQEQLQQTGLVQAKRMIPA